MAEFFTVGIIQTALEIGLIYALVAIALFISYSILNIADLSTDGSFTLGTAVSAVFTIAGHPILGIFMAMLSGSLSGFCTAFLQTTLGIESILSGIIVNTGLYTINLAVMGFSSNLSIFGTDTVFTLFSGLHPVLSEWGTVLLLLLIVLFVAFLLRWFFGTGLGLSIRATGDSPAMVRASSINPAFTITVGLCLSNALTALSGSLIAQYNKASDINLGNGKKKAASPHLRCDSRGDTLPHCDCAGASSSHSDGGFQAGQCADCRYCNFFDENTGTLALRETKTKCNPRKGEGCLI